jgi:AMP phosphorylase
MQLSAKPLDIDAGGRTIAVLNRDKAEELNFHPLDRIELHKNNKKIVCILDITTRFVKKNEIGTYVETTEELNLKKGDKILIKPAERPESVEFIREKVNNQSLSYQKTKKIIEIASFVTALHINSLSMEESEYLSRAMAETGEILELKKHPIYDKHSIGGVPGDKTTLLVVPIVAAAGLTIPKTSSKAITSPAGTADRMGVLTDVELSLEEIKKVVEKTNGCIVWGGAVDLAPADDLFIQVEYPISIDPLLLPSVMSKKKSVNADHVVIDIPMGRGAKIKTISEAEDLADCFIELGNRLGMKVKCAITYGEQPVGFAIGPALEAKEALETLMLKSSPKDLIEKITSIAGILLDSAGEKNGKKKALSILNSRKAEKKFREIIGEQGGNPDVKLKDIKIADKVAEIKAQKKGKVLWVNNAILAQIARAAGAPKDKGSGLLLNKKINDPVKKGDTLFTIYSESERKLNQALEALSEKEPFFIRKGIVEEMFLKEVPGKPVERFFFLER